MSVSRAFGALRARSLPDGSTILVAADRRARLRGLAGLERLPADQALLIERCRSVHTAGMRFALDLLWLDREGNVIRVDENVRPRRLRTCARARAVLETNAGQGERFTSALAESPAQDQRRDDEEGPTALVMSAPGS